MREFGVKDSGKRQEFATGMVRDTQDGKPRPDLISPLFMMRLGAHLLKGAVKYTEHNWAKGQPFSRALASLCRHLEQFKEGDESEDHLAAVAFGCMVLTHYQEAIKRGILPAELDDLPRWVAADPAEKQETLADVRTATYECAHCGADMAPCRITCDAVGMVPDICPVGPDGMADWRLVEGAAAVPDESPMVRSDCAGCKWDNGGLYWECGHCDDKYSNWTAADVKDGLTSAASCTNTADGGR